MYMNFGLIYILFLNEFYKNLLNKMYFHLN